MRLIPILFLIAVTNVVALSQTGKVETVSSISRYAASVDRFTNNKANRRIFADVSSATEEGPDEWKEFRNEKERTKAETGDNMNQIAFVWTRTGKVVAANITFTSPSGDWAHLINYYYREDGSVAKIRAQLNTFYGDLSIVREKLFDSNGKVLRSTTRYLDLQTRKPKAKPADFFDQPVPMYKKVSELPFSKLL